MKSFFSFVALLLLTTNVHAQCYKWSCRDDHGNPYELMIIGNGTFESRPRGTGFVSQESDTNGRAIQGGQDQEENPVRDLPTHLGDDSVINCIPIDDGDSEC